MKSVVRRVATPLATLAIGAAGVLLSTAPAQAASYSTAGICGSGYKTVWSSAVSYRTAGGTNKTLGTVYLGYNSSNGNNCAYTLKNSNAEQNNFWGYPTRTVVKLLTEGSTWGVDDGKYGYYAGPVYRYGKGRCVKLVADVTTSSGISAHRATGWLACG